MSTQNKDQAPSDDPHYWLALHRAPGLGAARCVELIERYRSPRAVFDCPRGELTEFGLTPPTLDYLADPDWDAVQSDTRWLNDPAHHLITLSDPRYPPRLREIADPPPILFVQGEPHALAFPQLAVVGSRNATPAGCETAFSFAKAFANVGLTITGGLALGIDAAGHRGALGTSQGTTVAVAGCGLDRVYPTRHRELASQVAARGALVSEFVPGTPPIGANFPRRNRIISGLSLGVLVVEAASRSGSLITARLALEQGREVFAVPGSIHNPLSRGCHLLIRQGAKLVESVEDVLEEVRHQVEVRNASTGAESDVTTSLHSGLDPDYERLLECLGHAPASVDTLVERTALTAEAVSSMLLILELRGHVTPVPGGTYARVVTEYKQ